MRVVKIGAYLLVGSFCGAFFGFLIVNLLLGCESWDPAYWTATNSCLTPTAIWEVISK